MAGTPPILSLAAVQPGIEILLEAGMDNVREKSLHQGEYLLYLTTELLAPMGFSSASPPNQARRGSHIALRHPEAFGAMITRVGIVNPARIGAAGASHVWFGAIVVLSLLWSMKAGVKPGLTLHFLGATALTLMFGFRLAGPAACRPSHW